MDELIRINYDSERPTVNGRDLHDSLGINTKYADWFPRMCEYGFSEGQDCSLNTSLRRGVIFGIVFSKYS